MSSVKTIKAVECLRCERIMRADGENFFATHGNLTIGLGGGIIGNNFDDDGMLKNVSIHCIPCYKNLLLEAGINTEQVAE